MITLMEERTVESGDMHFIFSLHTNISGEYETLPLFICVSICFYVFGIYLVTVSIQRYFHWMGILPSESFSIFMREGTFYNQVASSACFLPVDDWITKDLFVFELSVLCMF